MTWLRIFNRRTFKKSVFGLCAVGYLVFMHGMIPAAAINDSVIVRQHHLADTVRESVQPFGFFDLRIGPVVRTGLSALQSSPDQLSRNSAFGVGGCFQNSVLWNLRLSRPARRFTWADILSAELFTGSLSTSLPHESGNFWLAYKFEFGFGARYTIDKKNEVGINLIVLEFSRDNVSGNISGSEITGRWRHGKWLLVGGAVSRHDRVFGVIRNISGKVPMMAKASLNYLLPAGHHIGATAEYMGGTYYQDDRLFKDVGNFAIYYGIYF